MTSFVRTFLICLFFVKGCLLDGTWERYVVDCSCKGPAILPESGRIIEGRRKTGLFELFESFKCNHQSSSYEPLGATVSSTDDFPWQVSLQRKSGGLISGLTK